MGTQPTSTFIVSYFPMICECISRFDRTSLFEPGDEATTKVKEFVEKFRVEFEPRSKLSGATACLWMLRDESSKEPIAVLVLERAKEIGEDLKLWAEGKPEEWFDAEIGQLGDRYAIVLLPRFEKSIARQKVATLIDLEEIFDSDKYTIMFSPLHFVSLSSNAFNGIKHNIGKKITIYVIDKEYVDPDHPFDFRQSDLFELGTFDVPGPDSTGKPYLRDLLEEEVEGE